MDFIDLREANIARLPEFRNKKGQIVHGPDSKPWALSQWSNAALGELGEAANLIKKYERGDFTDEEWATIWRDDLAHELADTLIYLDLLAHHAGIDLEKAVVEKFNMVSNRVQSTVQLRYTLRTKAAIKLR